MIRTLLLSFLALSLLLPMSEGTAEAATFKLINRNKANKGKVQHWLFFVASKGKVPGHAFVVWGKWHRTKRKWIERHAFGLYPRGRKLLFGKISLSFKKIGKLFGLLSTVPGRIAKENTKTLRNVGQGLGVYVTPKMYNYALRNTKAIRTGKMRYNLIRQSCVDFTATVAKAIGLNTPSTSGLKNHPQGFIKKLKQSNS